MEDHNRGLRGGIWLSKHAELPCRVSRSKQVLQSLVWHSAAGTTRCDSKVAGKDLGPACYLIGFSGGLGKRHTCSCLSEWDSVASLVGPHLADLCQSAVFFILRSEALSKNTYLQSTIGTGSATATVASTAVQCKVQNERTSLQPCIDSSMSSHGSSIEHYTMHKSSQDPA